MFIALKKAFCDANQRADRAVIQITEFSFTCSSASLTNRVNLSYRQLHAYVMRHYLQMPRKLKEKELLTRLMINTDETMLRDFADLTDRLDFEFLEIIALKQCSKSTIARARFERSKSLLVTNDVDEIKKRRCELSRVENYVENDEFLFVNHLHNEEKKQGEKITFFFVRKSVYFAFFERLILLTLNSISRVSNRTDENMNRSQDAHISQKRRKQEQQRQKLKRQKQQRQKQERLKLKRLKLKRLKLKRQKQEQKRQKLKRQEQEQKRLKQKQKQKRQKQKILKRVEQERQEQERQEQERLNKKRLERERLREKQKMIEQERLKKERLKKEEQERKEKEKRERQKQEKRERQKQEKRERQKQEKRERQKQEKRKRQKQEGRERLEYQSLENQQRLQNQQRLEQKELLEKEELDQEKMNQQTEQDVNRDETSANLPSTKKARKSETQLEKRSDNTKIRINFKFREEDF